jgi:hypothetical protein
MQTGHKKLMFCLVLVAALQGRAGAHADSSGGLRACDHQANFDDVPCHEVDRSISESAAEFRVNETKLRTIVRCESRFNPHANSGSYKGLFQQASGYWSKRVADFNAHRDPDVGGDIYSPFDNARVSARMLAAGMDDHWPRCD